MSVWSKEELEEMCGDDIVEQLAFLSGCHQHELCNGNPSGWIIPDEVLRRFAELIVQECAMLCRQEGENKFNNVWEQVRAKCDAQMILEHFGVEE